MGFRIIDRRERLILRKMAVLRQSIVEAEAERFVRRKGDDDAEMRRQFIDKVNNIRQSVEGANSAQVLIERLEEALRNDKGHGTPFQGPIEPSVVLDLL